MARTATCLALVLLVACSDRADRERFIVASVASSSPAAPTEPDVSSDGWPEALPLDVEVPQASRALVVYLDAGHGAENNPGNSSCFCEREQDFTLSLLDDVTAVLEEHGMTVVPSRTGSELVSYASRLDAARKARADAFVSLHSDIRGDGEEWSPDGAKTCLRSERAPGFSVLYADEGAGPLVAKRLRLARAISDSLLDATFTAYAGGEYVGLYEGTPADRGVFVDRHVPDKRIFLLRKTEMPAVIVETHNALDPREALAFEDPLVRRAFGLALARGIVSALGV
jgi:N-acetylmuramoyl-L-alanine amidase